MGYNIRVQHRGEDSPEQKARNDLRYQGTIAGKMQRANDRLGRVDTLRALAKGVPDSVLPAGGIHSGMSEADVQAATDKINRYRAETGQQGAQRPPYQPGAPQQGPMQNGQTVDQRQAPQGGPAQQGAPQVGATRAAQGGGMEQLVQSQSGPRWVAYVPNAPAANGPDRTSGGQVVQRQMNVPKPLTGPTGNRTTDAANLAQNQSLYAPGGLTRAPQPYQPHVEAPSQADAVAIAERRGSPYGGSISYQPGNTTPGYTGTTPPPSPTPMAPTPSTVAPSPTVVANPATPVPPPSPNMAHNDVPSSLNQPPRMGRSNVPGGVPAPVVRPDGSLASAASTLSTGAQAISRGISSALGVGTTPARPVVRQPNAGVIAAKPLTTPAPIAPSPAQIVNTPQPSTNFPRSTEPTATPAPAATAMVDPKKRKPFTY